MAVRFEDIPYTRPEIEEILSGIRSAEEKLRHAAAPKLALEAFEAFHRVREGFVSAMQIADIRFTQDVRDEFYSQENDWFGEHAPLVETAEHQFYEALLACPYQEAFDEAYGPMLLEKLRYTQRGMSDALLPLLQEENRLLAKFQAISGTSEIAFGGQVLTAEQLYRYKGSYDRAERKAAWQAEGAFFAERADALEDIFEQLVQNRNAQARALGAADYSELSVIRMQRMGYGLAEIASYREQIKTYWVPVVKKIKELQRKRLGLADWKGYDNLLYFPDVNPAPQGDSSAMRDACAVMFHEISEETGIFFDSLVERNMFDLDSREGKAPGGYCGSVDSLKSPFIFSNFNGTTRDIDVLIHESGHAFAAYEAYKNNLVPECREASSEVCETHSTAMELLTMPWHTLFFGSDADRYNLFLMERTLTYLPGGCALDEFQTEVYRHPEMSRAERHQLWLKLRKTYEPHFADFDDIPMYSDGRDWLFDPQMFLCPFYMVDYGMARNLSLQLFFLAEEEPEQAWKRYETFVSFGGTKTYCEAAEAVGLSVPFHPEPVKRVIEKAFAWVEAQNRKVFPLIDQGNE